MLVCLSQEYLYCFIFMIKFDLWNFGMSKIEIFFLISIF